MSHHSELLLPFMGSNLMLFSFSSTRHCRTPYVPRLGRVVITSHIIVTFSAKGQVLNKKSLVIFVGSLTREGIE